jgi:hypothetical protein
MKAQTATSPQHTANISRSQADCPQCGHPGPHQVIDDRWIECGRTPTKRAGRWIGGCGATWRTSFDDVVLPHDDAIERVVDLVDASEISVVDTPQGLILTWDSALSLARRLASDPQLAALIRQQELGGAA